MKDLLNDFNKSHHEFDYSTLEGDTNADPFKLFEHWMREAVETNNPEANAFVLSTCPPNGQPSSRILYLKDMLDNDFVFYTNYNSRKGQEISVNNRVSMLFFWPLNARQVRIEGTCSKVPSEVSDAYFKERPRGSQIGAWASDQSTPLADRYLLERKAINLESSYPEEVPRPPFWGGYRMQASYFEFWQGRPSRLHDRIVFEGTTDYWTIKRLHP